MLSDNFLCVLQTSVVHSLQGASQSHHHCALEEALNLRFLHGNCPYNKIMLSFCWNISQAVSFGNNQRSYSIQRQNLLITNALISLWQAVDSYYSKTCVPIHCILHSACAMAGIFSLGSNHTFSCTLGLRNMRHHVWYNCAVARLGTNADATQNKLMELQASACWKFAYHL